MPAAGSFALDMMVCILISMLLEKQEVPMRLPLAFRYLRKSKGCL